MNTQFDIRKALGRISIIAGEFVIVGALFVALAFIGFNAVQDYPSFWLGAAGVFGLLVMLGAFYAASHPATKIWPGTFIGFGVAILLVIAASLWKPFDDFAVSDFFWGLGTLLIVIAIASTMRLAAWLYYRVPKPKPAPAPATPAPAAPWLPSTPTP